MFPCYDEPNIKATFRLRVLHPKEFRAMSNSPARKLQFLDKLILTEFYPTPKMSTYLLVLTVSDFKAVLGQYNYTTVRLYAEPGRENEAKFSLNITLANLREFQKLLGINYKFPKLDGIAVPTFAGGMENWGLIVYDNSILLKSDSKDYSFYSAVSLICHEIAHQWFGNLVTLYWWDYVWLNEGFASYFAAYMGDLIYPYHNGTKTRFMDNLVVELQDMLKFDSENHNESLNRHVENPLSIRPKFNSFGYTKGAAIVRFMSLVFKNFFSSLSNYLQNYKYSNVKPINLYGEIAKPEFLPPLVTVEEIMNSWTDNPGFPLITVNVTRRGPISDVVVTEERFTLDSNLKKTAKWWIPFSFVTEENLSVDLTEVTWINGQNQSYEFKLSGVENGWILANHLAAIYCRINYDEDSWKYLALYLNGPNYQKIHVHNRIQLVADIGILSVANKVPLNIAMELLKYLKQETDELVHQIAKRGFIKYNKLIKDTPIYPKFLKFVEVIYGKEETARFLRLPKINYLVADALKTLNYRKQNYLQTIGKIGDHIYTESDFMNANVAFEISSRWYQSELRTEFMENIEKYYEYNKLVKKNFDTHNIYEKFEQWLNKEFE